MGDKGETMKQQQNQQQNSSSPNDPLEEDLLTRPQYQQQQQQTPIISPLSSIPLISPLYIPNPEQLFNQHQQQHQQSKVINPKRPRYETSQWKPLPSPAPPQQHIAIGAAAQTHITPDSSSSPNPSSPSHQPQQQLQIRKGKYVSPVWRPDEMLWLARAWRVQHDGLGSSAGSGRAKSRAQKDREVAEFLKKHGVERNAKIAGTKWDNMLGEFRKVYEWERRSDVGKSYFRLSSYERKMHRLPASFDEGVYDELSLFMGFHTRTSAAAAAQPLAQFKGPGSASGSSFETIKALPPPPSKDDFSVTLKQKQKQQQSCVAVEMGGGNEGHRIHGHGGGSIGLECSLRRIGKIRMTWEESVSLWAEDGREDYWEGRVNVDALSFLNADQITFLDDTMGMAATNMEALEHGPLRGFSVDRFACGQHLKVFGRRTLFPSLPAPSNVSPSPTPCPPHFSSQDHQDRTDYYLGRLRAQPSMLLPTLLELSTHLQVPPPHELRFPLGQDVYRDLPRGKDIFFTSTSTCPQMIDCRAITHEILGPLLRTNTIITPSSRDSFIGIWDDCINRIIFRFCALPVTILRNPSPSSDTLQDQWPNVTGFVRNLCLWRGEETHQMRECSLDPSFTITEKILWTYGDQLPYILGYYAVGYSVTFCALSVSEDEKKTIVRTDLCSFDLSNPTERLKMIVPCWRVSCLLPLLAELCSSSSNSDFERVDLGFGDVMELTPNTVKRSFSNRKRWVLVKEIYEFLTENRIPHVDYVVRASERELELELKPRGCRGVKPKSGEQLVEALKYVTKALVGLHDLSFMHRDIGWDKVMKVRDGEGENKEWFVAGFEGAVAAPQIYPRVVGDGCGGALEMWKGLHGVKVDVWGVGHLIRTCGFVVSKPLKELQVRCLDPNPDKRPTAADCYHHLLQLQSSSSTTSTSSSMQTMSQPLLYE